MVPLIWSDTFEVAGLSGDVEIPGDSNAGRLCESGKTCDVMLRGDVLVNMYDVEQASNGVMATLGGVTEISDVGSAKLTVVDGISEPYIMECVLKLRPALDVIIWSFSSVVLDGQVPGGTMVTVGGGVVVATVILPGEVDFNISGDVNSLLAIFISMTHCLFSRFSLVTGIIVIGSFPN